MPITLIAPPHTPLDERGDLNLHLVEPMAAHLSQAGVSGVFVCGSTGEGMSLTVAERKEVAETWMGIADRYELDVIAQVGANCQRDAIELAAHASQLGVRSISAHAPCYFRPKSVDDLIDYFAPVAAAAGDLPFYFYDIPELTGVRISTSDFLRRGQHLIPTLAGVKYTNSDLAEFQECMRLQDGAYEMWWGCDEALLAGYALGVQGAVGSTYNFIAPLIHRAVAAFDAGQYDQARRLQGQVVDLVHLLAEYGYSAAAKAVMELHGLNCGPVRPPLRQLSQDKKRQLFERIRTIGFPFRGEEAIAKPHVFGKNGAPGKLHSQSHADGEPRQPEASSRAAT